MMMSVAFHSFELSVLSVGLLIIAIGSAVKSDGSDIPFPGAIWFVHGDTSSVIPSCTDMCLTVITQDMNGWSQFGTSRQFPVGLYPCRGNSEDEIWQHDSKSALIKSIGVLGFCLDADYNTSDLFLSSCSSQSSSQKWKIEQYVGITGIVSNSENSTVHIRAETPNGGGQISKLYLQAEGYSDMESFTMLNYADPLRIMPHGQGGMILRNGGFEECGIDPGSGFIVLDVAEPIPLCGWHVVEGEVEYTGRKSNLWPPFQGKRCVHLNSARIAIRGSLAQMLPVKKHSNYSLVFNLAGNLVTTCGNTTKTLRVSITPSTVSPQLLWFDVAKSEPGSMGWKQTHPLEFTALGDYANLTFQSLTEGSCGPVIDNVRLREIQRPTEEFDPGLIDPSDQETSSSTTHSKWIVIMFGVVGCASVSSVVYGLFLLRMRKRARTPDDRCVHQPIYLTSRPWDSQILSLLVYQQVKKLTWKELEKATNNFTSVIGEGGFSRVYLARFPDETVGAVKVEKERQTERSCPAFKQELYVFLRARHVHLVNLIGFCNDREKAALVFEYMANGNLHQRLHPNPNSNNGNAQRILPWQSRMTIGFQVAAAIEYLHEVCRPPIVHSDIKSANVLLDDKYNAKLCDFGFSKAGFSSASVFHSTVKGSLGYLDPQYCKSGVLSKKSDIYSFGVVLLELLTGMPSFCMEKGEMLTAYADPFLKDPRRLPEIIDERLNGYFDGKEAEAIAGICALCIQEEANMRPCMTEILRIMREVLSPLSITASCQQLEEIIELYEEEETSARSDERYESSELHPR